MMQLCRSIGCRPSTRKSPDYFVRVMKEGCLLQDSLTPIGSTLSKVQAISTSALVQSKRVQDSNFSPGPQFHAETLRRSSLARGFARSRSEAVENAFGVSRDREGHIRDFGSLRAPKPLNTIMYLPRLTLPKRGLVEDVTSSLSFRGRTRGREKESSGEEMER
jgi:hypothetical protein